MTGAMPRIRWIMKLTGISFSRVSRLRRVFRFGVKGKDYAKRQSAG